jgi:hypothetical protein
LGRVEGSAVREPEVRGSVLPGYARLDGVVPVLYPPGLEGQAAAVRDLLAALERFGEGFLRSLAHALWSEHDVICGDRAEELLAESLGPGGWGWLLSRPEFEED